jgi:hypothetical protein
LLKTGYNILPHEEFSPHLYAYPQRMDTYTLSQPHRSLHILLPEVKQEQITCCYKLNKILINNTMGEIRNACKILIRNLTGRDNLGDEVYIARIMLRWFLSIRMWMGPVVINSKSVSNQLLGSVKGREFLGSSQNNNQLPKKAVWTVKSQIVHKLNVHSVQY